MMLRLLGQLHALFRLVFNLLCLIMRGWYLKLRR